MRTRSGEWLPGLGPCAPVVQGTHKFGSPPLCLLTSLPPLEPVPVSWCPGHGDSDTCLRCMGTILSPLSGLVLPSVTNIY